MSINIHPTTGKSVHLWAPIAEVEAQALAQLENAARLPWVFHHVAAMADVHFGIGATVGSVIAMREALAPAAVGVDIGCVDMETEFLSPSGWQRIDAYAHGTKVAQYDPETGEAAFVDPTAYVRRLSSGFWHFHTKYGIDQMLSRDHRMLVWRIRGRDRHREREVVHAGEIAEEHNRLVLGAKVEFQTTFSPLTMSSLPLSSAALRVQVAVMADGHFDARGDSRRVRLKFVKERKKARLRGLLAEAGIPFEERSERDARYDDGDVTAFFFEAPVREKSYGRFWGASLEQLRVIAGECLHWDGSIGDRVFFTRDKESADFVQYAFSSSGMRSVMRSDVDGAQDIDYRVFGYDDPNEQMIGIAGAPKTPAEWVPSVDGLEYCFTVPSGFWVMRRNGKVVITGNCGMGAIRTNLTASDLPDNLEGLRSAIEAAIPVGFDRHEEPAFYGAGMPIAIKAEANVLFLELDDLENVGQDRRDIAARQAGTLGGGNHFIEVCLDTDQRVWLMLHSGSRNIGKVLAEHHIAVAKKLAHNQDLPDPDLAVFLAGTPEMAEYRVALMWAQRFAMLNRRVMLELLKAAVQRNVVKTIDFEAPILCHHNYVSEEIHFGENVLVTRKGAIRAERGQLGIIPGSMGTRSYIVRGLGNPESFCSASHGAGRRMSRGAAKRKFTVADLAAQTEGVCCRKDVDVIDEIPGAYKAIEAVMANQADLVEVVTELKQVLCVKG